MEYYRGLSWNLSCIKSLLNGLEEVMEYTYFKFTDDAKLAGWNI